MYLKRKPNPSVWGNTTTHGQGKHGATINSKRAKFFKCQLKQSYCISRISIKVKKYLKVIIKKNPHLHLIKVI